MSKFGYAYDAVGNITTWTQQHEATSRAYDFAYDAVDQLTAATYRTTDAVPSVLKRYGYVYDKVGNRTTEQIDDAPRVWAYNNTNQMISQAGGGALTFEGSVNESATVTIQGQPALVSASNGFTGTATVATGTPTVTVKATDGSGNTASQTYEVDVTDAPSTFVYDNNGNLTAHGTKTYEWDAENRLVRVLSSGLEVARFTYDGFGRRVEKIAGGVTRAYVYDGEDIVEERAGGTTTRIVHGPGIDQPLAAVTGSTPIYYLADHLGSIAQHTNASQQVTLTRTYDPFGNLTSGVSTSGYAFTGREWDAEIGLYYYRARYYDAGLGRFISADPIGLEGGINIYAYVINQPAAFIDPSGLGPEDWWNNLKNIVRELNPVDPNSSAGQSVRSIKESLVGIVTLDQRRIIESYDNGPLGQTINGPSWAYWGTRAGVGVAAGAMCVAAPMLPTRIGQTRVGWKGGEIIFTRPGAPTPDLRINPFGGKGPGNERLPHYHRRGPGGIGRHRPWDGGKGSRF